jgi:hypothetical protein
MGAVEEHFVIEFRAWPETYNFLPKQTERNPSFCPALLSIETRSYCSCVKLLSYAGFLKEIQVMQVHICENLVLQGFREEYASSNDAVVCIPLP